MERIGGPIIYLTQHFRSAPGLEAVAALAEHLGRDLRILLQTPDRMNSTIAAQQVQWLRESLSEALQSLEIQYIGKKTLGRTLYQAGEEGSIVALVPGRRRGLSRTLKNNDFERLLLDSQIAILALPRSGELPLPRRILFPADYSPRSQATLAETVGLCKQLGAELHLLHVYGPDGLLPSEIDQARRNTASSPKELFALDQQQLTDLGSSIDPSVPVTTAYTEGRAHTEIMQYAKQHQVDLIVMATHGPRSSSDIWQGTTTSKVVIGSPLPVLAIPA